MNSFGEVTIQFHPANPAENEAWMALCRDPRWNYQAQDKPLYYYCKDWDGATNNELCTDHKPVAAIPEMDDIHAGALAPKFVFERDVELEPTTDGRDVYLHRLICVLCQRFVILSRPNEAESLEESSGMPEIGERYWWRYWDNDQNVYQVCFEKFRDSAGTFAMCDALVHGGKIQYRNLEAATSLHGMPPGEFTPPDDAPMWMRVRSEMGSEQSDLASFFDHMWSFRHHGTTRVPLWDANLMILASLAGVPPDKSCRSCSNPIEHSLRRCTRCKLVYYCKDGVCQREDWLDHKKMCNYFQ